MNASQRKPDPWNVVFSAEAAVRVLAIFFGGQDHQRQMLIRRLRRSSE
jgi:hypothetical protein